ncbi:ribose 5-phosphate isomerase B [Anaerobacillus alkalilacustris]|uniref:Ribose 5-phosphate isomerase B n=1 Tax=Anaerobacillus alkalilacustris TaxID=393763 RepID=A0A1S2LMC6_9BACI|nr:ribose 5-phosphate isomerase B [Anaerobacillus alkalilacustris]OIJ12575.1 ribose 5-phosphate isomerase B [Anaerobacillus alkalilacustris]
MKVYIGSDHGGFFLKNEIITLLQELQVEIEDVGAFSTEAHDFGPIAKQVAEEVSNNFDSRGILICGTGIGMSIMANKVTGIRAAVVHDVFSAEATRAHNNSNVLCMGERVIGKGLAFKIVETWLSTSFDGGKHERRVNFIHEYEKHKSYLN